MKTEWDYTNLACADCDRKNAEDGRNKARRDSMRRRSRGSPFDDKAGRAGIKGLRGRTQ